MLVIKWAFIQTLQVLEQSVQLQTDDALLKAFIELGDHCPKFLRSQLDQVVEFMLKVMGTKEVDDSWKQLSLEMVVTIAENGEHGWVVH